VLKGPYPVA